MVVEYDGDLVWGLDEIGEREKIAVRYTRSAMEDDERSMGCGCDVAKDLVPGLARLFDAGNVEDGLAFHSESEFRKRLRSYPYSGIERIHATHGTDIAHLRRGHVELLWKLMLWNTREGRREWLEQDSDGRRNEVRRICFDDLRSIARPPSAAFHPLLPNTHDGDVDGNRMEGVKRIEKGHNTTCTLTTLWLRYNYTGTRMNAVRPDLEQVRTELYAKSVPITEGAS